MIIQKGSSIYKNINVNKLHIKVIKSDSIGKKLLMTVNKYLNENFSQLSLLLLSIGSTMLIINYLSNEPIDSSSSSSSNSLISSLTGTISSSTINHTIITTTSNNYNNNSKSFFCQIVDDFRTKFDDRIIQHFPTFCASLLLTLIITFLNYKKQSVFNTRFTIYIPKLSLALQPFDKSNRLDSVVTFMSYAYNIIFIIKGFSLPATMNVITHGVLVELLLQLFYVFTLGLTYYPILVIINLFKKNYLLSSKSTKSRLMLIYIILGNLYCSFILLYYIQIDKFCLNVEAFDRLFINIFNNSTNKFIKINNNSIESTFLNADLSIIKDKLINKTINTLKANDTQIDIHQQQQHYHNIHNINAYKKIIFYFSIIYMQFKLSYLLTYYILIKCIFKNRYKQTRQSLNILELDEEFNDQLEYCKYVLHNKLFIAHQTTTTASFKQSYKNRLLHTIKSIFLLDLFETNNFFKYSKHVLNLYTVALVIIYYITYFLLNSTNKISDLLSKIVKFFVLIFIKLIPSSEQYFKDDVDYDESSILKMNANEIKNEIVNIIYISVFLSLFIYLYQLASSLIIYKKNILNSYSGLYKKITTIDELKNNKLKLVISSTHYAGYFLAYVIWGFITFNVFLLLIVTIIKIIFKITLLFQYFILLILPIIAVILLKYVLDRFLVINFFLRSKTIVTNLAEQQMANVESNVFISDNHDDDANNDHDDDDENRNYESRTSYIELNNIKFYYIFMFFSFFFDCFLGLVSCMLRFTKIIIINLINMPRLDLSIFGRRYELLDKGYLAYVSFIHFESYYTNPIKILYLNLLYKTYKFQLKELKQLKYRLVTDESEQKNDKLNEIVTYKVATNKLSIKKQDTLLDYYDKKERLKKKWLLIIYSKHIVELKRQLRHVNN